MDFLVIGGSSFRVCLPRRRRLDLQGGGASPFALGALVFRAFRVRSRRSAAARRLTETSGFSGWHHQVDFGMGPMTDDDVDATSSAPDPDDHVARLQAEIDAVKARRAGYRAKAAETVARGGPARASDEELGIIKTDDTVGKIATDASHEIGSRLSRVMARFRRPGKK
jgi:hypothetical protein